MQLLKVKEKKKKTPHYKPDTWVSLYPTTTFVTISEFKLSCKLHEDIGYKA